TVGVPLGGADLVALLPLGLLARQGGDDLVAAHADVAVDFPDLNGVAVGSQGPVPGEGVLVVGVDQGPVDVEDHGQRLRARGDAPEVPRFHRRQTGSYEQCAISTSAPTSSSRPTTCCARRWRPSTPA